MKIANFTNIYLPFIAGVCISISNFKDQLEKLGHKVYVLAPSFDKRLEKDSDSNEILRYLSIKTNIKISFPIALKPYYKINRSIKKIDPDIIHTHQSYWIGRDAYRFAKKLKKPLVYTFHTNYEYYMHYLPIPKKFQRRFFKLLNLYEISFCNKCDAIIAPTENVYKDLTAKGVKAPIYVIPSGINIGKFSLSEERISKLKNKFNIKPKEKVILYLGRIEKEKNIDLLIQVFTKILKKYSKVKIVIVGDGQERKKVENLEREFPKRVIFPGKVSKDKVPQFYNISDIFIQPSVSETQGITTQEAMVSGLAVVAAKSKMGAIDFIENNQNGLIVKPEEDQFYAKIVKLIENPKLLNKIKETAKQIKEEIDIKKCAIKLEKVYLNCIENYN
jgi:glycosyltransferase involved in cell wall biosynthesis